MKKDRDTRMRSRSSSRVPEARNGSDSSKAKTKKAKDTEKSSKASSASYDGELRSGEKGLGPVPIFRNYSFCIDEFPSLICQNSHKLEMTVATKAEMEKQERNRRSVCAA